MSKYFGYKINVKMNIYIYSKNGSNWNEHPSKFGIHDPRFVPELHTQQYINDTYGETYKQILPDYSFDLGNYTVRVGLVNPKEGIDYTKSLQVDTDHRTNPSQEYLQNLASDVLGLDISNVNDFPKFENLLGIDYGFILNNQYYNPRGFVQGFKDYYGINKGQYNEFVRKAANFANNYDFLDEMAKHNMKLLNDRDINYIFDNFVCQTDENTKLKDNTFGFELIYTASDGSKVRAFNAMYVLPLSAPELSRGGSEFCDFVIYNADGSVRKVIFPEDTGTPLNNLFARTELGYFDVKDYCEANNIEYFGITNDSTTQPLQTTIAWGRKTTQIQKLSEREVEGNNFVDVYGYTQDNSRAYFIYREDLEDVSPPKYEDKMISFNAGASYTQEMNGTYGTKMLVDFMKDPEAPKLYRYVTKIQRFGTGTNTSRLNLLYREFFFKIEQPDFNEGYDPEPDPDNPYEKDPDGNETAGGNGSFDDSTDKNGVPDNPNSYITLRGAPFNSYYLTASDVINFGSKLYSIPSDASSLLESFAKIFGGNPIDSVITYHTIPVIPSTAGRGAVYYANSLLNFDAYIINNEFVNVYCGTINVNEYYGNFLDYETKAEIYLPFIGYQQLNIEDIMNESVEVVYHINVITGALMAYIVCGGDVRYQFAGNCKEEMPLSATSNNLLSVGLSAISGAVVGGAANGVAGAIIGGAQGLGPIQEQVSHGSGLSSSGGMMGIMRPFLTLTRPRIAAPANYGKYKGFPLNVKGRIGDYRGFTVVNTNRINGPMTGKEKEQIEQLLKNGVKL